MIIIEDGITEGKYIGTSDITSRHFKRFQDFLYLNLHKYKDYQSMLPSSNHPGHFFESIEDISLESLKLHPVIDKKGTYICNALNVIAKYLTPLSRNEISITDTFSFK